jgi:hypothetical protein
LNCVELPHLARVSRLLSEMSDGLAKGNYLEEKTLPEDVLFAFLIANLRGSEDEIRPLIVDHPNAELLWQGAYPPDVAELLVQQYEGMGIARVEERPDRVLLQSSASPIPLAVVKIAGEWRVDASPIIEFRKRAQKPVRPDSGAFPARPMEASPQRTNRSN